MYSSMPSRKLVSQEDSSHIENAHVPRSKFLNTWTRKTTFNHADLVPIMVEEILPGDHMRYSLTAFIRMNTPLFPLFDNLRIDTFFFFVPMRILWDNFKRFMGEQDNPGDSIAYTVPQYVITGSALDGPNVLADYFGIPTGMFGAQVTGSYSVSALPFRAYNLIYKEWFRDENLVTSPPINKGDGPDTRTDYGLLRRAKSHDYFTSCLPWPQKFTAPTVPIGGLAPVIGLGFSNNVSGTTASTVAVTETGPVSNTYATSVNRNVTTILEANAGVGANIYPKIYADLAQTTGVAINVLRQAWLVQQLLERDARGGTRYVEKIRSHFGVISPDFRLQRPEYIGGGQSPLNITPIAQTAPTAGLNVGALGAAGTAAGTHSASYAATEHGYIIGLINVRSELSYQQGLHKMWTRLTQYDFYWPSLAGLGEQAVLEGELYKTGIPAADNVVFGYQERWQEYRTKYSQVTGRFNSMIASTMDNWHLAQKFVTPPTLGPLFIADDAPISRVISGGPAATAIYQEFLADILFHRTAVRPIPTFGTPVTLGRF